MKLEFYTLDVIYRGIVLLDKYYFFIINNLNKIKIFTVVACSWGFLFTKCRFIILLVDSASALTCFIRYIYY